MSDEHTRQNPADNESFRQLSLEPRCVSVRQRRDSSRDGETFY